MAMCDAVCSMECKGSYGTILFDHLAAHRAGLTGSQVTVVTVLQVHANFLGSLHLELLHSSLSLGNIDLIVTIAHSENSPFSFVDGISRRKHSLTLLRKFIDVSFRKSTQFLETPRSVPLDFLWPVAYNFIRQTIRQT
jgi:hypothetical protein